MTIYHEDPHDSWWVSYSTALARADDAQRRLFWRWVLPALAIFWLGVAWGLHAVL
jgi:hypothetical protein